MRHVALLLCLVWPAAAFASIGPERAVSEVDMGPSVYGERNIRVASNGDGFLVVFESGSELLAQRISATGEVLDPGGFPLDEETPTYGFPDVASDGRDYLVVSAVWGEPMRLTRVQPDGLTHQRQLDRGDVARIASNGTNYLLIWRVVRQLFSRLVDRDGNPLGPAQHLCDCGGTHIEVASNGVGFLIATAGNQPLYLIAISGGGDPAAPRQVIGGTPDLHGLAANGTKYSFVLREYAFGVSAVNLFLVDASGNFLRPAIKLENDAKALSYPNGVLLVSLSSGAITASRVSPTGALVDPAPVAVAETAGIEELPAVASNGRSFLVAWIDRRFGYGDVFGVVLPVGFSAAPLDGQPDGNLLSFGGPLQTAAATATRGDLDVVTWAELNRETNKWELRATRFLPRGDQLDGAGFVVSDDLYRELRPAVAATDQHFIIVWFEAFGYSVRARIFSWNDPSIASAPIVISSTGYKQNLGVVWNGEFFLIVWDHSNSADRGQIYGRRVRPDGTVVDPEEVLLSPDRSIGAYMPAVAWNGRKFMLTWSEGRRCLHGLCPPLNLSIHGSLLGPDLTSYGEFLVSADPWNEEGSQVSTDGQNFLIAWSKQDGRERWQPAQRGQIATVLVTEEGQVLEESRRSVTASEKGALWPLLTFDGSSYFLAWRADHDVRGMRIGRDGAPDTEFVISAAHRPERLFAIAGSRARIRTVYARSAPELRLGAAERLFTREVSGPRRRAAARD